jgi:hypothetical protein
MGIAASIYLTMTYQISLGPLLFILSVLGLLGFATEFEESDLQPQTDYHLTALSKFNKQVV